MHHEKKSFRQQDIESVRTSPSESERNTFVCDGDRNWQFSFTRSLCPGRENG